MEIIIKDIDISDPNIQVGIEAIMYEHFKEVAPFGNPEKINVNWEYYKKAATNKILISLGCFYDKLLVGYLLMVIINPPHYKEMKAAILDTIFILKDFRVGRIGLKFITKAEKIAKEKGASVVHWSAKEGSNLDKLFRIKKYAVRDIVFCKEL